MARCTAPSRGHRTSNGEANCPACRGGRSRGYNSYSSPSYSSYGSSSNSSGYVGQTRQSSSRGTAKPTWSRSGSSTLYTPAEVRALTPVRKTVVERSALPQLRDVFLCHAWDDRRITATQLNDLLETQNVSVWFSEKDIPLGMPFMRQIDKGLANSRIGIVLVTPAFLKTIANEGVADKELSALLARDLLIPIAHNTTFDALREVSPMLGSRNGLSTEEDTLAEVAAKIAELVQV